MSDMGNGTYFGSWFEKDRYLQATCVDANGGLKGEYHHGSNLMAREWWTVLTRNVHFMWDSTSSKAYFPRQHLA